MAKKKVVHEDKRGVRVDIKDLYQFMICECRYGYRRNNHLMPWGAYDHVKTYLPIMYKTDAEHALNTACQICEECISDQLCMNFYDALDDEHRSRANAIEFIEYLLNWIHENGKGVESIYRNYETYLPYDYDNYKDNLEKEKAFRYRVFEIDSFEETANRIRELTTEPVDKRGADEVIFTQELGVTQGVMNHIDIKTKEYPIRVTGELIRIIEPESHKGKMYLIELVK